MRSPATGKKMDIRTRNLNLTFRKETFEVKSPAYYCEELKQFFTDDYMDEISLKQVHNQYRDKYNIPFPDEIIETRKKYGLSAAKMSEILGFGVNSYRNYETGEVPSLSNANLIRLANDPSKFKSLVLISEMLEHDTKAKEQLLNHIEDLILETRKNRPVKKIEDYLLGNNPLPDNYSGYRKPNIEKLTEMVVYFSDKMSPYVTMLNKLLFYSDFIHYKKKAVSISGTRYRAIDMGPVPSNYDSIYEYIECSKEAVSIKITMRDWGYSKEFIANRPFNSELFNESEIEALNTVFKEFQNTNTRNIVERSHEEDAWKDNYENGKKLIDYKYSFDLKMS